MSLIHRHRHTAHRHPERYRDEHSGHATAQTTHLHAYLARCERIAPPRAASRAPQRQRDANRRPLERPERAWIAEAADAAAFCAPCWPLLAAPGGFSSSCIRVKLLMHFSALISAHTDRGDTSGVSREDDARRARARPSARDRKRIGGSGAAAHQIELSIIPELTWTRRISAGGGARTSRAPSSWR